MTMVQREIEVLSIIIEAYIASASPVGSRTVSRKSPLKLSAASMRNIMADLTDKGYLAQPHTSAGRIPTAKAFQYYVDELLPRRSLTSCQRQETLDRLTAEGLEISHMLRKASCMVSRLSHQIAVVLAPDGNDVSWRNISFSLLSENMVLVVLVLDGGLVKNRVITIDNTVTSTVTADELTAFSNYLNTHFAGLSLMEARSRIIQEAQKAEHCVEELCTRAIQLARIAFANMEIGRKLYVEGTANMLDQAEFTDAARLKELLSLLEERSKLLEILDSTLQQSDIRVFIDNDDDVLKDYGLITAPYGSSASPLGAIGVIGPLRMNYAAVLPVVDCFSHSLSTLLKNRFLSH